MLAHGIMYELMYEVRGAAMEVYNHFGPGLLESVYEKAMAQELTLRGLSVETQVPVAINYKGATIGDDLRLDLLVEGELIVELKSVEEIKDVYYKQLRTYLKLLGKEEGLLINFGEYDLKKGMRRVTVNEYIKY
jgi:GxxExxY protein